MRNCVGGYAGRPSKTGELERQSMLQQSYSCVTAWEDMQGDPQRQVS